jgi:hypothetical protein
MLFCILIFTQCNFLQKKENNPNTSEQLPKEKTPDEILAEEKARQDSIDNAAFELIQKTAFNNLMFGMEKDTVEQLNETRQMLGKYYYNFNYSFNGENKLYKVRISSEGVQVIKFDSDLKSRYQNLVQIIQTKYGKPVTSRDYPSIFDVQKSKKYLMNQWEIGIKQINLALQENAMNSYSVSCEIFDKNLNEAELQRLKDVKNHDVIEAAEKF